MLFPPNRNSERTRQITVAIVTGLSLLLIAATVSARHWLRRPAKVAASYQAAPPSAEAQGSSERPRVGVLVISLRLPGFVPREITRPAGDYFISVTNMSGETGVSLGLERENGERLGEANLSRGKPSLRQNVHLTPGTYLLTEARHPEWVCRITVTPQ